MQVFDNTPTGEMQRANFRGGRGDCYQAWRAADGALLVVVADVSGKGLKAAIPVSLLIGALRRKTSYSPLAMMSNLNRVLVSRSNHGFVTGCCLSLSASGDVEIANAGHPALWWNKPTATVPELDCLIS